MSNLYIWYREKNKKNNIAINVFVKVWKILYKLQNSVHSQYSMLYSAYDIIHYKHLIIFYKVE